MENPRILADGLRFPEGPVWMPDGAVLVVEVERGTLTRIAPDGTVDIVAAAGRGPNGAAVGPDGKVWVCDDGGFAWTDLGTLLLPLREHGVTQPDDFEGGAILRVDVDTGDVETVYESCDGRRLVGPNDLVFDGAGGFWFTDHGKVRHRDEDRGGLYWATADGSEIREVAWGLHAPNGVGLSPDGSVVYVAETHTGRLWAWDVVAPGEVAPGLPVNGGARFVAGPGGLTMFDSLAVEEAGAVCVATLGAGGVTVIEPSDGSHAHVPLPAGFEDGLTTNIAFGGADRRTAALTLSGSGRLLLVDWPRPGLRLAHP